MATYLLAPYLSSTGKGRLYSLAWATREQADKWMVKAISVKDGIQYDLFKETLVLGEP